MRPPPIRTPLRRLGDRSSIDMRGAEQIKTATASGNVQRQPQTLQIPPFRVGISTVGGDIIGGGMKWIVGVGAVGSAVIG